MDAIVAFAEHITSTGHDDLSAEAIAAIKTFILDSFGVGVAGSAAPFTRELVETAGRWGSGPDARVWVCGTRLPAPVAAMCNSYQLHNSEYDCVHEAAVVHPITVVLPATTAHAERAGGVAGQDYLTAVALGVDVAAGLGIGSRAPLRFFRPATAGAFGATAAIGKLMGLDARTLIHAFSIAYGQLSGTMQAHTEGSPLLAMQMGFSARNAIVACDLAANGLVGPKNLLEGPFGYYPMFEGDYDLTAVLAGFGETWRITEVAHKPFPSGRATHGVLDGLSSLMREHGFAADQVAGVACTVPPLTHHLVARPVHDDMAVSYARLSAPYVLACALLRGTVGLDDFGPEALADSERLTIGRRVTVATDDNPDPNALTPVTVTVVLEDGREHRVTVDTVYGSPAKPMSRDAHLAKFRENWVSGAMPLPEAAGEKLIGLVDDLEAVGDVTELVDLMVA
jgi:2-methylcitrate dehydratase PrpD